MIENHMVIETALDRARERAQEHAYAAREANIQDAYAYVVAEIETILIDDVAKVNPKRLVVPIVSGATGFERQINVGELIQDYLGYDEIEAELFKLIQTDAAKKLRELIAARYVSHNAAELAELRVGEYE